MQGRMRRRHFLATLSTSLTIVSAGCLATPESVGPTTDTPPTIQQPPTYDGWIDGAPTYDRLDAESVTVSTGVQGAGGHYAYEPAAVAVSPGTRIVWRWTGKGGLHNVVGLNRQFRSTLTSEEGHTFSHTVGDEGVVKYYCGPHRSRGMRGVLLVRSN